MRRAWIDEEKPKTTGDDDDILDNDTSAPTTTLPTGQVVIDQFDARPVQLDDMDDDLFMPDEGNEQRPANADGAPLEDADLDELDALLKEHESEPRPANAGAAPLEEDDFDELDALLREHEDEARPESTTSKQVTRDAIETESHADKLEAMDELEIPQ
jgi:hypothetical protein